MVIIFIIKIYINIFILYKGGGFLGIKKFIKHKISNFYTLKIIKLDHHAVIKHIQDNGLIN